METDLEKVEVKKKELQDKRKELLKDIELEEARKKAEQNEKVMEIICRRVDACLEKDLFCQSFIHSDGAAERIGTCVADTEQVKSSLKFSFFSFTAVKSVKWDICQAT